MPREDLRTRLEAGDLWVRTAVVLWVLILIVVSLRVYKDAGKVVDAKQTKPISQLLYEAGEHWIKGQPLYADEGEYRYSPGVAAVLSLFVRAFSVRVAALLWLWMGAAAFFAGFVYWMRTSMPVARDRHYQGLLVLLATPLLIGNFNTLQTNPVCLACMMVIVPATLRKQWLLAAVCIAVATSLKVYPLAIALVLLVLFPRRLWLATLVGLLFAGLLPFVLGETEYVVRCYREWVVGVMNDDRSVRPLAVSYRDVALLWRDYAGYFDQVSYQFLQFIGALGVGAAADGLRWGGKPAGGMVLRSSQGHASAGGMVLPSSQGHASGDSTQKSEQAKCHFLLGLVLCWVMLLGPSTESATYMMMGPLAAWMILEGCVGKWRMTTQALAGMGYGILVVTALVGTTPKGREFMTMGWQPVAAAFLLAGLVGWWRGAKPETGSPKSEG